MWWGEYGLWKDFVQDGLFSEGKGESDIPRGLALKIKRVSCALRDESTFWDILVLAEELHDCNLEDIRFTIDLDAFDNAAEGGNSALSFKGESSITNEGPITEAKYREVIKFCAVWNKRKSPTVEEFVRVVNTYI